MPLPEQGPNDFLVFGGPVFLVAILLTLSSARALSLSSPGQHEGCFETTLSSPYTSPYTSSSNEPGQKQTWCYRTDGSSRAVFAIDESNQPIPEMTLLIDANGTLTHFSRANGRLTKHRLKHPNLNPIGAPLTPPVGARYISPAPQLKKSSRWNATFTVTPAKLEPGLFFASVPSVSLPWRAYWWPYANGLLHLGPTSPLGKYDAYRARHGEVSNAQAWELEHHSNSAPWAGYCHAWAAASVIAPEPKHVLTDGTQDFNISDLKAFTMLQYDCPKFVMYGKRNSGREADDASDVDPVTFHNVLTYFIGHLGKSVIIDTHADPMVFNKVISGFKAKLTRMKENEIHVDMDVTLHGYDVEVTEDTGIAESRPQKYSYYLTLNEEGEAISGKWASKNPDFIWTPLAPGLCGAQTNAFLTLEKLQEILALPVKQHSFP